MFTYFCLPPCYFDIYWELKICRMEKYSLILSCLLKDNLLCIFFPTRDVMRKNMGPHLGKLDKNTKLDINMVFSSKMDTYNICSRGASRLKIYEIELGDKGKERKSKKMLENLCILKFKKRSILVKFSLRSARANQFWP